MLAEVADDRDEVQAQLCVADDVVAQFAFDGQRVGHTAGPSEPVHPAQPGKQRGGPSFAGELSVDVSLFPAETPERGVEARPGGLAAAKDAESLHGDLERFTLGIEP